MAEFKDRIRSLRTDKGLTQEELAKELGISRSTIGMYETGKREADYETLELIADFFNVDMNYLIGWVDSPHSWEQIANDNGICPPNDYEGDQEDWFNMKKATDDDHYREEEEFLNFITHDGQFRSLAESYKILNEIGRQKACEYVSDLAEQPKYTTPSITSADIQSFPIDIHEHEMSYVADNSVPYAPGIAAHDEHLNEEGEMERVSNDLKKLKRP